MIAPGFTLLELVLCLLLLGIAAQAVVTPFRHQSDLVAVRVAREEIIALLHQARAEARLSGGATVVFEEGVDPFLSLGQDRSPIRVPLERRGVRLEIAGSRSTVTLRYGPLGVPRFASATLRVVRREAEADLVVSSYGRVRR